MFKKHFKAILRRLVDGRLFYVFTWLKPVCRLMYRCTWHSVCSAANQCILRSWYATGWGRSPIPAVSITLLFGQQRIFSQLPRMKPVYSRFLFFAVLAKGHFNGFFFFGHSVPLLGLDAEERLQNRCYHHQKDAAAKPGGGNLVGILVACIPFLKYFNSTHKP